MIRPPCRNVRHFPAESQDNRASWLKFDNDAGLWVLHNSQQFTRGYMMPGLLFTCYHDLQNTWNSNSKHNAMKVNRLDISHRHHLNNDSSVHLCVSAYKRAKQHCMAVLRIHQKLPLNAYGGTDYEVLLRNAQLCRKIQNYTTLPSRGSDPGIPNPGIPAKFFNPEYRN